MAELNRKIAPESKGIERIKFPSVDVYRLDNGCTVYSIPHGSQDIIEMSVIVPGGKAFEPRHAVSGFTGKMLQEGTRRRSGFEFANALENIGAFLGTETGIESATADLTCLTRHFHAAIELLAEMLLEPAFDENEFRKLKERSLNFLELEEQKTDFLARRAFAEAMFGETHPYGKSAHREFYEAVTPKDLVEFHQKNYASSNMTFVISGRYDAGLVVKSLNEKFGKEKPGEKISWENSGSKASFPLPTPGKIHLAKPEAKQASIRVGHMGFDRHHSDFHAMDLVTMLFGGYFGSRLMKNIREDKGYTYGIYASWLAMKYAGYLHISADVGVEYREKTFEEIRKEISLLLDKGTTDEELQVVKNYKLGKSLSRRETPSQMVDLISTCFVNQIPFEDLDNKFGIVQAITKEQVVELARKYLHPDQLLEISAGGA